MKNAARALFYSARVARAHSPRLNYYNNVLWNVFIITHDNKSRGRHSGGVNTPSARHYSINFLLLGSKLTTNSTSGSKSRSIIELRYHYKSNAAVKRLELHRAVVWNDFLFRTEK